MTRTTGYGADPYGVRLPSLAARSAVGGIYLVGLLILTVGLPAALLKIADQHGVGAGLTALQTTVGGTVVSSLSVAAYLLRPTRAYAPAAAARAVSATAYLLFLVPFANVAIHLGGGALSVDYSMMLEWFALIPLFGLAAAVLSGLSDYREPLARLRVEFPE